MREIVQRPLARTDLLAIWRYTYQRWGEEQAARYLRRLDERIRELAVNPQQGRHLESIRRGYYGLQVERHFVVYSFSPKLLVVERVLHRRMNVDIHLTD